MPPFSNKSKSKNKDGRQSRSRNTTPSSVVSVSINTPVNVERTHTSYLHIHLSSLLVPDNISYDTILEEHGGTGGIPDPKHLDALSNNLKSLSMFASKRSQISEHGIRCIATKKKDLLEEEREREQAALEAEEKENLKRAAAAAEEEASKARKGAKVKRKKERTSLKEERPLAHGAHGVAKQDGSNLNSNSKCRLHILWRARSSRIYDFPFGRTITSFTDTTFSFTSHTTPLNHNTQTRTHLKQPHNFSFFHHYSDIPFHLVRPSP